MARTGNYFWYLMNIVDGWRNDDVCLRLFYIQFRWDYTVPLDADRAEHGICLRLDYFRETNRKAENAGEPCNVLEMLVALSIGMAEVFSEPGDRHPERWFWEMLDNLGVAECTFGGADDQKFNDLVGNWMSRNYDSKGRGGLFPLKFSPVDQRNLPIWEQANAYLCERM